MYFKVVNKNKMPLSKTHVYFINHIKSSVQLTPRCPKVDGLLNIVIYIFCSVKSISEDINKVIYS